MFTSSRIWLAIVITSAQLVHGYADFGIVTAPCNFEPIFTVPQPKFVPEDAYMRYEPYSSSVTAVAPSLRLGRNGTETSWSLHFVNTPTRTTRTRDGDLRRRGVFSGDPPIATCRPCDTNGNPTDNGDNGNSTDTSGTPHCSITSYDGVFRDGSPSTSSSSSYCFDSGYTGPLVPTPIPTEAGLPCCPVCYPISTNVTTGTNTSFTATTGVFSPTATTTTSPRNTSSSTRSTSGVSSTTSRPTSNSTSTGSKETVTVTATKPVTITQITLSIETITPTSTSGTPVVTTGFNTIIGCGTASGCGTVVGSGTVYLAPFGYPAVVSSGTVSGCAPTIIGCGTMIATRGVFTAPTSGPPATITACGEGTGSATLIGSGTVWPAGFNDQISFISSGTLTGSGRVKGCGTITGYGTFTVSESYTGTATVTGNGTATGTYGQPTTVNVYVSYCPTDLDVMGSGLRLASNFTDDNDDSQSLINPHADDPPDTDTDPNRYALSALTPSNPTSPYQNSTTYLNTTTSNPLCHICPQDSGICCPPFTDCGTDGHCPWTALEGCGYALYGYNIVDLKNSSVSQGMSGGGAGIVGARLKAPGLPGSGSTDTDGSGSVGVIGTDSDPTPESGKEDDTTTLSSPKLERRFKHPTKADTKRSKLGDQDQSQNHEHRREYERGLTHRFAFAHFHRH